MRMGVGLHRFDDSRAIEAKWESILDQAVRESYPLATLARVSLAEEWRGVDRSVIDDHGETTTLEYKCDERWRQTGNAFLKPSATVAPVGRGGC